MDRATIERIDSFIYRHRVGEAMIGPAVVVAPGASLQAAAQLMQRHQVSALLAVDESGRPTGIMTENDIMRAVAEKGAAANAGEGRERSA